jgi:hypothetical protein
MLIISSFYFYDDSNVYSGLSQNKINDQDVVIFAMYRVCLFLGYVLYCIYVYRYRGKNHVIINLLRR